MFRAVSGNLTARPHSGESSGENVAFRRAGKSGAPPSGTDLSEVPNSDQLSVKFSSGSSSDPGRRRGSGPGSQEGTFPGTSNRESGSFPPEFRWISPSESFSARKVRRSLRHFLLGAALKVRNQRKKSVEVSGSKGRRGRPLLNRFGPAVVRPWSGLAPRQAACRLKIRPGAGKHALLQVKM